MASSHVRIAATGLARAAGIAAAGLAVGALSLAAQANLGNGWSQVGNSGAVWLLAAFVVGALMGSELWAATAGLGTLVGAVIGYYLTAHLVVNAGVDARSVGYWLALAVAGGPVFGLAGRWWRTGRDDRRGAVGSALLGAAFLAEGIYMLTIFWHPQTPVGWIEIVVGIAVPVVLGRSARERLVALALLLPLAAAGVGVYEAVNWAFMR